MNQTYERLGQIRKFNPGTFQSDEEVISQFVVREREFGIVMECLQGNINSPSCQHGLIVAPRGRGKTMLLARVAAELHTNSELSDQLLPVRFMEESHEIFNLADFWLETLFYLAGELREHYPELSRELRNVHANLAHEWRGSELEERACAAVLDTTDRLGKQLILMVENLQALCRDVEDDFGWKLRKVLQTEPQIILLATATSRFNELDDAQHAFFELFRIIRLEPLGIEECRRLWQMVSGDIVSKREIRPLQILTGGDPRLLVIIGEFAQHRSLIQLMDELVRLIDDHTEYFRAHLEGFAKTERRVYLALIDLWQPSTTGEITARARMDVRIVSSLLGRLVERGAIVVEGTGRKRVYVAAQRLYSIYYKLRRERDEAAVVNNLIHFMAVFYTDDELPGLASQLIREAAQSLTIREGIQRAIAQAPQISRIFAYEDLQNIGQASVPGLWKKAVAHGELGEYEAAIAAYDQMIKFIGDSDMPELQVQVATALVYKGFTQGILEDTEAEMATYDAVDGRFGDSEVTEIQVQVANALFNKGVAQGQLGNNEAAVASFDVVVGRYGDSEVTELQMQVTMALINKGIIQVELGNNVTAMDSFEMIVELFGDSEVPELHVQVAKAMLGKGIAQAELGDTLAAMATCDAVNSRFGDSEVPELQAQVAKALINKGVSQEELGDIVTAIATFDSVVGRFEDREVPELQVQIAKALVNKGMALVNLGEPVSALTTYDEVTGRFREREVPELQVQIAIALLNKAEAEILLGRTEKALHTCDEFERRGSSLVGIEKGALERWAMWIRTRALLVQKRPSAAMDLFRSIYAGLEDAKEETLVHEMLDHMPNLIEAGASELDIVDVLSSDSEKAGKLMPLVVALRLRAGEVVRAPEEVLEIATDINKRFDTGSRNNT